MDIVEVCPDLDKIAQGIARAQQSRIAIPDLTHLGKISAQQRWAFVEKMLEASPYPIIISHRARDFTKETLLAHLSFLKPFQAHLRPLVVYGDPKKEADTRGHLDTLQTLKMFCDAGFQTGATVDLTPLNQTVEHHLSYAHKKIQVGAEFLITQLVFDVPFALKSLETLMRATPSLAKLYLGLGPENPQAFPALEKIPGLNIPHHFHTHQDIKEAFHGKITGFYQSALIA